MEWAAKAPPVHTKQIEERKVEMATKTIVLIHGNFVSYHSWAPWVSRYEARGYKCIAVPYPLRNKSIAELRRIHPDPELGKLTLDEVVNHLVRTIQGLSEKPIVIAHSFGGMLTQLLVNRGLPAAAVAIDSVPPQGVTTTEWSFIKSLWPVINPFHPVSLPYMMSFEHFQYTFVNGMPLDKQKQAYELVVPESVRLSRAALSSSARVDFKKAHPPLLLIAGEKDHIMPASLNRTNFNRYKASPSVTEFKEFPGRNHFLVGSEGWTEIADYALNWAEKAIEAAEAGAPEIRQQKIRLAETAK
jgi:pimeloyl-ACP methyl ester carboxylesterase